MSANKLWIVHVEDDFYVVAKDDDEAERLAVEEIRNGIGSDPRSWASEVSLVDKTGAPLPRSEVSIDGDWGDAIPIGDDMFPDAPDLTVREVVDRLLEEAASKKREADDRARNGVLFPDVNPQPLPPVEAEGEQEGDDEP